jgi:hypothetical protein
MTTEELKTVLEEVCGRGVHMNWFQLVVFIVATSMAAFLGAYWKKLGENLATHADIEKLTTKVESIKNDYQKDLEEFKDSLVRKKIIFEHQIEAYNKLKSLKYMIMPSKSYPEYDFSDALEDIAREFHKHGGSIKEYLIQYSGIIPRSVMKELESCLFYCEEGKFGVTTMDVETQGFESAKLVWNKIISAQEMFANYLEIK